MALSAASAHNISKSFSVSVLVFALLFGAAALWGTDKRILGLFHDDGIYAVVGKALAQGDGYRIASLPGAPAQTKYPFSYSFLLFPLWLLDPAFPHNIALLKGLNIVILAAIFVVAAIYYRRYADGSTGAALWFAVLVCANPIIFGFTDYVLSDLWLVLLTLCALTLCGGAEADRGRISRLLLLSALIGLACLSRAAALPLVIAGAVHGFATRGWRGGGIFLSAVLLFVAPWLTWLWSHSQPPTDSLFAYYTAYDATAIPHQHWSIVQGNAYYLADMLRLIYLTPLLPGVGYLLAFFSLVGVLALARRENLFAWVYLLTSIALLLLWPFHPGRYLAPLVPLILLFLFRGMALARSWLDGALSHVALWQWLSRVAWSPVLIILLLDGVWLSGYLLIRDERTTRGLYGRRLPYSWTGFEESFAWVRAHTEPDALLATAYDPMYYLYTGRRSIRPALHRPASYFYPYGSTQPDVGSVQEIKPQLVKLGIGYLIIDPMDGYAEGKATVKLFDELVRSFGNQAEKVFTSTDGMHRIYRLAAE